MRNKQARERKERKARTDEDIELVLLSALAANALLGDRSDGVGNHVDVSPVERSEISGVHDDL